VYHCPSDAGGAVGPSYGINAWYEYGLNEAQITYSADSAVLGEKWGTIPEEHFVWWLNPWPQWPMAMGTPIKDREPALNAINATSAEELQEAGLQSLRHTGGSNWLFADSHAKWSKLERIWGNATTTNQLWPTRP
jgi:prepilin-type processing-associated H-X9-DG protein